MTQTLEPDLDLAPPPHPGVGRDIPRPLPPAPEVELPESRSYRLKSRLLGPPLHTKQLEHERLGIPTALAVFSSDCISSSAYATEEILRVLLPVVGIFAFSLVLPITSALLVVLFFLILSYRETIKEYPTAGGAYMVTRDNFGSASRPGGRRVTAHRLHPDGVGVDRGRHRRAHVAHSRCSRRTTCSSRSDSSR